MQTHPRLTLIAAVDQNRLLANEHGIPWHLPLDVEHFRSVTRNQWLLLGRRTYEEMRDWFKPAHTPLTLTSRTEWHPEHGKAIASVEAALRLARDHHASELICCGGAKTYAAALPFAQRLIITQVHHRFPPASHPVYFPPWNQEIWHQTDLVHHPADQQNPWSLDIITFDRAPTTTAAPTTTCANG
ncbi:dihydrofolate reductase [Phragmitibacter flavus]|uniref:dihydrofolate reductase n=1 Tax=Phragmitibacter flavus TaxID=2576071 RepID=A0A5R8KHJ3_9BACT|nr:dihydrofolate reductase [Phragmitibacter flavus]TLD71455.1 dihydrofolate reductase [Phragmitibacter flavus]